MSEANAHQIGGQHYASTMQHWDLVVDHGIGYLEGCATKYVCRWRKKDGQVDLKKAVHYLDKLIEAVEAGKRRVPGHTTVPNETILNFAVVNDLTTADLWIVHLILKWEKVGDLKRARTQILKLLGTDLTRCEHGTPNDQRCIHCATEASRKAMREGRWTPKDGQRSVGVCGTHGDFFGEKCPWCTSDGEAKRFVQVAVTEEQFQLASRADGVNISFSCLEHGDFTGHTACPKCIERVRTSRVGTTEQANPYGFDPAQDVVEAEMPGYVGKQEFPVPAPRELRVGDWAIVNDGSQAWDGARVEIVGEADKVDGKSMFEVAVLQPRVGKLDHTGRTYKSADELILLVQKA